MTTLSRAHAAQLGIDTVRILEAGEYVAPSGFVVRLRDRLARAVTGTKSYAPADALPRAHRGSHTTRIEVTNETTLAAVARLVREGHAPAALNFASAKNPGGGFLRGDITQEESLARSSGLYACIAGNAMYAHHRALGDPMYTAWVIYSPAVPIIRTDDGALLETPIDCAFVTAPAVRARDVLELDPTRRAEIRDAMRERIERALSVAALHDHRTYVLGAWGCGVFANDPVEISDLFADAVAGPFAGAFERIVFAVLDTSRDQRFIGPFRARFTLE
jgi:uncharacterized protein (TIGR02452 family)